MNEVENSAFVIDGKMALPYQYFAGATGSRFIVALRDEKTIFGVRCPKCEMTFVPPRQICDRCFADLSEHWIEVAPTGTVTGFTVIRYAEPYQPKEPPYLIALILLDGADTPIPHLLECGDQKNARIGMRVCAVFSETPQNNLLAIAHFVPSPG
jgi:uncharacterized OB-fold protein